MVKLYGIKNCDSVKKAQKWLQQHHIAYDFHDFRSDGLTAEQLQTFASALGWAQLLNRNSTSWRQLEDSQRADLTAERALQLMLHNPTLIKRPVLVTGTQTLIGFNADQYTATFNIPSLP